MPKLSPEDLAFRAEQEIGCMNTFFPILQQLSLRWAATRPWEGHTIGLNLHLTTITGALINEMTLGGGQIVVSAANSATTDKATVAMLRAKGIEVYTGGEMENPHLELLYHAPDVLVDVGFGLIGTLLDRRPDLIPRVLGGVELTRSGINRLKNRTDIPIPVINVNDGRLKNAVENRHGVGGGVWQAVTRLTGMHLSGRRVAVVGYGPVGKGIAAYARAVGLNVEVVERDPVRRLFAHYDGFPAPSLADALTRVGILVTATGVTGAVKNEDLSHARDGLVLLNAGHGGQEIDVAGLKSTAEAIDHIAARVVRYRLHNGNCVTLLADGHPLNIVMNSGSPEPVLLHFAVLGLALEHLCQHPMPPGEVLVPDELEAEAASLALEALKLGGP